MAGRVVIDLERCKGCGLCVSTCPRQRISMGKVSNRSGFFPAQALPRGCTGCAQCAMVCPDAAISVYREHAIEETGSGRRAKKAAEVIEERS